MTNTITREQWLNLAGEHLRILFESVGETVPTKVRASCGFPSKGALGARNRTVGQCWNAVASADCPVETRFGLIASLKRHRSVASDLVAEHIDWALAQGLQDRYPERDRHHGSQG